MSLDLTDDKSILVQVMACCRQATNHYLKQCQPSFMMPYGTNRPQRVNSFSFSTWMDFRKLQQCHCNDVTWYHKSPSIRLFKNFCSSKHKSTTLLALCEGNPPVMLGSAAMLWHHHGYTCRYPGLCVISKQLLTPLVLKPEYSDVLVPCITRSSAARLLTFWMVIFLSFCPFVWQH